MKFAEYAKMYVALAGLVASGILGVSDLPTSWKLPLTIAVAIAGAFATWATPNRDPDEFSTQYFEGQ